jgi:hypothetical protein
MSEPVVLYVLDSELVTTTAGARFYQRSLREVGAEYWCESAYVTAPVDTDGVRLSVYVKSSLKGPTVTEVKYVESFADGIVMVDDLTADLS